MRHPFQLLVSKSELPCFTRDCLFLISALLTQRSLFPRQHSGQDTFCQLMSPSY